MVIDSLAEPLLGEDGMTTCLVIDEHGDREMVERIVSDAIRQSEYTDITVAYTSRKKSLDKSSKFDIYIAIFYHDITLSFRRYINYINTTFDIENNHIYVCDLSKINVKNYRILKRIRNTVLYSLDSEDGLRGKVSLWLRDIKQGDIRLLIHLYKAFFNEMYPQIMGGDFYADTEKIIKGITRDLNKQLQQIDTDKYGTIKPGQAERIIRLIEFPPEYRQAGLGILNYFAEVIRQKNPDIPFAIRIEQEGLTVRMVIETHEGYQETIEHTLDTYAMVVSGKATPKDLLTEPAHVMALEHKLEMTAMELRHTHDMLQLTEQRYEERITSLEAEATHLRQFIGDSLRSLQQAQNYTQDVTALLQFLTKQIATQQDSAIQQALATLQAIVQRGVTPDDERTVTSVLTTIGQRSPGVFERIVEIVGVGAISGTAGNLLTQWILPLGRMLGLA